MADLSNFVTIDTPFSYNDAPASFRFDRIRNIDLPWNELLKILFPSQADGERSIASKLRDVWKHNFLEAWGIQHPVAGNKSLWLQELLDDSQKGFTAWRAPNWLNKLNLSGLTTQSEPDLKNPIPERFMASDSAVFNRGYFFIPASLVGSLRIPVNAQDNWAVLIYPTERGNRYYLPLRDGTLIPSSDFLTGGFDQTWDTITSLEQVYVQTDKTKRLEPPSMDFSYTEVVDAAGALLLREYEQFRSEDEILTALEIVLKEKLNEIKKAGSSGDLKLLEEVKGLSAEALGRRQKVREWKSRLSDAATDMGYVIFFKEQNFPAVDKRGNSVPQKVSAGELYKKSLKTVYWRHWESIGFFQERLVSGCSTFDYYQKIEVDWDPWIEIAAVYRQAGFSVTMLSFNQGTYQAEDGAFLEDLLEECRKNEEYRKKCVLALPVFQDGITGRRLLAGYHFFVRPLPAFVPSAPPKLSIRESLEYRYVWLGTKLGELVGSIPLAPGEERQVTLSRSSTREAARATTATSVLEVGSVERQDFESMLENEVQQESSKQESLQAEVGGSYGAAHGSASFSTSKKVTDISKTLNRSVVKTSQEMTRRARSETSVTISEKAVETASEAITYKVKNVNEGGTLNLLIYRLNNHFKGGLRLVGFSIIVEDGPSLFSGTNVRHTNIFSQDEMDKFGERLKDEAPWLNIDSDAGRQAIQAFIQKFIIDQMNREWVDEGHSNKLIEWKLKDADGSKHVMPYAELEKKIGQKNKKAIETATMALQELEFHPIDIGGVEFVADAGALYIDTVMGGRDATEQYADDMRETEIEKRKAENALTTAKTELVLAKAEYWRHRQP